MGYTKGSHTIFYHRYHIVWITKYRYHVLQGKMRERIRDIIRQVSDEMGVTIVKGVLSTDHVHMFVEIPPSVAVSRFVQKVKGRSSVSGAGTAYAHPIKSSESFLNCANDTGVNDFGAGGISRQQVEPLLMR